MRLLLAVFFFPCAVFAVNPLTASKQKASSCAICDQIAKIKGHADRDEMRAARELADFIPGMALSKNPVQRKKELQAVLNLSADLVEKDEQFEIAQYFVGMRDENPKMFDEIVKLLPAEKSKRIVYWEQKMRQMFKYGEEPPKGVKPPAKPGR